MQKNLYFSFPGWLKYLVVLALLFIFHAPSSLSAAPYLFIKDSQGTPVFSTPVQNGTMFAIRYTHSVAQTPVTDLFIVKNNEIWLDSTEYSDFGAGLPHAPDPGQKMTHEHGKLSISGYNRRMPDFEMRIGRVANHELLLLKKGNKIQKWQILKRIPLAELAEPGETIKFTVEDQKK